ncbi:MAG: hypothetical protein KDC13_06115 [Bacteroidetes bacterium]|nr:hypothetical protein [Bacteroidota bacterium]
MKITAAIASIVIILFSACKKEENVYPAAAPVIAVLSASPDTITEFRDSLVIEISYEDQNGDLGNADPDIKDLEIKDARLSQPDYYHVIPLSPEGTTLFINGTLRIVLPPQFRLGTAPHEQTTFTIRLRDQNGAWSEPVDTDQIVITEQ